MLHAVNLKDDKTVFPCFKEIYREAFPKAERVPLFLLKRAAKTPRADCFAFFDDEAEKLSANAGEKCAAADKRDKRRAAGIAYFSHGKDFTYLFFLAVRKDARGKNYGSQILQKTRELYPGRRVCLNIEELNETVADYAMRVRRKKFYEKNGFTPCGYKVIENKVVFEMLSFGGDVSYEEYRAMLDYCFGKCFSRLYSKFYAYCEKTSASGTATE